MSPEFRETRGYSEILEDPTYQLERRVMRELGEQKRTSLLPGEAEQFSVDRLSVLMNGFLVRMEKQKDGGLSIRVIASPLTRAALRAAGEEIDIEEGMVDLVWRR